MYSLQVSNLKDLYFKVNFIIFTGQLSEAAFKVPNSSLPTRTLKIPPFSFPPTKMLFPSLFETRHLLGLASTQPLQPMHLLLKYVIEIIES